MGEILLPGDDGFDGGALPTLRGTEVVENLNDEMNDASEHANSGETDDSRVSNDDRSDDDGSKDIDEESEEERGAVTTRSKTLVTSQKKNRPIKKIMVSKVTGTNGKRCKRKTK